MQDIPASYVSIPEGALLDLFWLAETHFFGLLAGLEHFFPPVFVGFFAGFGGVFFPNNEEVRSPCSTPEKLGNDL